MRRSLIPLLLSSTIAFAQNGDKGNGEIQEAPVPHDQIPPAPFLTAEESLATFQVHPDFEVEIVADDSLTDMPVMTKFDADGSIWVVEMRGYMIDLDATDEDIPFGRIVVLKDTDNDGKADQRTVFLDSLLLPRGLAIYEDFILYADQNALYKVERNGLSAGKQTIIDKDYAKGGNVEHKPNTLLQGLDNWIYSSKSAFRYREINGKWVKEATNFRGQWGITQDNAGRLYYNTNSQLATGDYLQPNFLRSNRNISFKKAPVASNLGDNRIHPIRINPGVNRAYMTKKNGFRHNVIDPNTFKLRYPTAAAGLELYRGDQFPASYADHLFITVPCGNLISILNVSENHEKGRLTAKNPLKDQPFIASTDERFRPVNLHTAPDGSLYLIDFSHGIIQHTTYLTSYLRDQYETRGLDSPGMGPGRIFRIRYKANPLGAQPQLHTATTKQLVKTLDHTNGWWRDTAQRLLIERADKAAPALLSTVSTSAGSPLARLHALYTLEGLGSLTAGHISAVLGKEKDTKVIAAALGLVNAIPESERSSLTQAIVAAPAETRYVKIHKARALALIGTAEGNKALLAFMGQQSNPPLMKQAAVAGLQDRENDLLALTERTYNDQAFRGHLKNAAKNSGKAKAAPGAHLKGQALTSFKEGEVLYSQICLGCHGADGAGMKGLGPQLDGSDWVTGNEERLISILLHGLSGPITLNGKKFESPAVMPGLSFNPLATDAKLAGVATYVRNNWSNRAKPVEETFVKSIREKLKDRNGAPFVEAELPK